MTIGNSPHVRRLWWVPLAAVLHWSVPAPATAQNGERPADRDVKRIIEELDHARDRFEDELDGSIKSSTIRSTSGEVNVERYLDDLQSNVEHLQNRFSSDYAASQEAHTLLRQATDIHTRIKAEPREIKGGSEWDTMVTSLERLAHAYGTTFPLPQNAVVRRMNDKETSATADLVAKSTDQLGRELDRERALPKPLRDSVKKDLDALGEQAHVVKSRVADSQPSTAEMRSLLTSASRVATFMQAQPGLLPGTKAAFDALKGPLGSLQQAYGLKAPVPGF